ncbi:MAG: maltose alpha-D-glucosyltransferase [Planctomycetales bacterium]
MSRVNDPLWYKDAVFYQTHVKSFYDSDGNGIGDFAGLKEKLPYLHNLGITAIWLLPFYPSPLKDDGYDIADYTEIHSDYGTMDSFKAFLDAAHDLDLKVITELVINHTSDQHPWFQRARRSPPGSRERDFYVWTDNPQKYPEARIIFKDFEVSNWTYDNVAQAYFWHRFYSHQPDLNFDNPAVWEALSPIVDFWLGMGVDGLRLDAVPYLYEREGTNCENLPETHEYLRALRRHVDENFPNRMLLAEANQWPEDAVAYFGQGDECHMAFHFPVMPRLYMSVHREDRFPMVDILEQTPEIPANCQWAMFLRNHDELTLEMVTDEERDYMYRAYASDSRARINLGIRRRLAPLMSNNRRRIELMNAMLFSLPGTPIVYYGDEIGMGDNIYLGDRNGMRTPMQWSADRNAGFSRANPQRLYLPINIDPEYHYESCNVEAQQNNSHSLLWWMKRLIAMRKKSLALSRGTLRFLNPANRRVLSFLREFDGERVLIVANLSRFVQYVELDLREFQKQVPVELFGGSKFPPIGDLPYFLTLAPHSFLWFEIQEDTRGDTCALPPKTLDDVPAVLVSDDWFRSSFWSDEEIAELLRNYFNCRLTNGIRQMEVSAVTVLSAEEVPLPPKAAWLLTLSLRLEDGSLEQSFFPIMYASDSRKEELLMAHPERLIARLTGAHEGVLFDALVDEDFTLAFLRLMRSEGRLPLSAGGTLYGRLYDSEWDRTQPQDLSKTSPIRLDRASASIDIEHRYLLKFLRNPPEGQPPEIEFGRYLAEGQATPPIPRLVGDVEFRHSRTDAATMAVIHEYVPHEANAWHYTLDSLSDLFAIVAANRTPQSSPPALPIPRSDETLVVETMTEESLDVAYMDFVRLLARRTADLHAALAHPTLDPSFAPERFSSTYRRSLYQSLRERVLDVFDRLKRSVAALDESQWELARQVLSLRSDLLDLFQRILTPSTDAVRIRCHGDFHLGHVLFTGKDVTFVNFESNPEVPPSQRRIKRNPLRDAASMTISFDYAARVAACGLGTRRGRARGNIRSEDQAVIDQWSRDWTLRVAGEFASVYLKHPGIGPLVPHNERSRDELLQAFLLERSLDNIRHDLRVRPHWLHVPFSGLIDLVARLKSS